jgi:predicted amidohydrolase
MELKIALAQMNVALGQPRQNEPMARGLVARAAAAGAQLVVLPELWFSGYDLAHAADYAAALNQGAFALMAELAKAHGLYLAGTSLEANPAGLPYNTAALLSPQGELVGAYRKVHLWAPMGEVEHMAPGGELPAFELPWGRTALAVCYDLRFPEAWRCFANAGARLVVVPAQWPAKRVEHWRLFLRARAVENQFFVAGCNRAGVDPDPAATTFGGYSAVSDPWGTLLVEGGMEPDLLVATLELDEVDRARRTFPFLADRRLDLYGQAGEHAI